jgi:phytoene dehydrogenase-like protein
VRSINVENGQACGVTLVDGTSLTARTVVANANAQTVFLRLVDKAHLPAEFVTDIRNIRTESSCFKINLAVEQLPTWAGLDLATCGFDHPGSITIAENLTELEEAFESARHGRMAAKPYLWILTPSAFDPTVAPAGKHIMSIFGGHVPYKLNGEGWTDQTREELFDTVVRQIARYAPGFGNGILHKQILVPPDLEAMFDLPGGHVHHGELSMDQIFFRRPVAHYGNYTSPIKGLFQCGASTHPGGGVTGVPGHNAAKVILASR